jgi:hypothetical protein
MAVDIFDREVAISRLALIYHAEHDTHSLCRSDTRFYDADQTGPSGVGLRIESISDLSNVSSLSNFSKDCCLSFLA